MPVAKGHTRQGLSILQRLAGQIRSHRPLINPERDMLVKIVNQLSGQTPADCDVTVIINDPAKKVDVHIPAFNRTVTG